MSGCDDEPSEPADTHSVPEPHKHTVQLEGYIAVYLADHHLHLELEVEVVGHSRVPVLGQFVPLLGVEHYLPRLHTGLLQSLQLLVVVLLEGLPA